MANHPSGREICVYIAEFLTELGRGAYGIVMKARTTEGKIVAVKLFDKIDNDENDGSDEDESQDDFETELNIFEYVRDHAPPTLAAHLPVLVGIAPLSIDNKQQLKLLNTTPKRKRLYGYGLVSEVIAGATFYEACAQLPSPAAVMEVKQTVIKIVRELHKIGVCHNDVSPLNIMLTGYDRERRRFEHNGVVLLDWGCTSICGSGLAPEMCYCDDLCSIDSVFSGLEIKINRDSHRHTGVRQK